MNEINKLNPLLEAMNDIDDAIVSETAPAKRRRPKYFKSLMIAAAAAVLCGATAITAVASIKPPKEVTVDGEPLEADYTVYTDDLGREIRTYAIKLPDYALGKEKKGCDPVGQVRVVYDDRGDGGWKIVDEEGTEFLSHINNKEVICEVIDPADRHCYRDIHFNCANFLSKDYDMITIHGDDLDGDDLPDSIMVFVYRYDDKETARRIEEKYIGYFDEERFDENVERHNEELTHY